MKEYFKIKCTEIIRLPLYFGTGFAIHDRNSIKGNDRKVYFSHHVQTVFRPTETTLTWTPRVRRLEREATSSAVVKNVWSYISTRPSGQFPLAKIIPIAVLSAQFY
jgi:beta-lactamase class A